MTAFALSCEVTYDARGERSALEPRATVAACATTARPTTGGPRSRPGRPGSRPGTQDAELRLCSAERCRGSTEGIPVTLTPYLRLLTEMLNTEEPYYATAIANDPVARGAALSQNGT